ncbi:MAG: DUF3536 domain-containing protein [Saprospiraceae bacterium]
MSKKFVCIHGHFYQPPRENAWLETVELQESARPFANWNARINFECYAPNAAARILDGTRWISKIRNNYNRISWNFGPTLLSWIEENDPGAYRLIQAADQRSAELCSGHGSAVAQVYSHLIMPLANYRDKVTQVYWGIRDFQHRFGRYPEGMWLAETAVDTETLEVLAAQGIQYTILAPRQAKAVRPVGSKEWIEVDTGSLDTRRPYWCVLPSGRRIALFFYHGGLAQGVAFDGLLNNGKRFADYILGALDESPEEPQLVHIATDGESYGHHHRFGEMALAAALNEIEDGGQAELTNYAEFLDRFPPTWEARIHEDSSWSCAHGVERWRSDCGCHTGGHPEWNQAWRKPLRETLNWLRDQLIPFYEKEARRFFMDPWAARNDYIQVVLNREQEAVDAFFKKHARRPLSPKEEVTALSLQEMQRHAILMFTSCGWFFDEIAGIETNQILQYALRAMDYAFDLGGKSLHHEFIKRLAEAPSNTFADGAASYLQNVVPTKVTLERVAMHFAVASVFEENPEDLNLFIYSASPEFIKVLEGGNQRLAIGRLNIRSKLTHAEKNFSYAVLYLGQQHIIGNISSLMNRTVFDEMFERSSQGFRSAGLGELIGILQEYFGPEKFTLSSLFTEEKNKIIKEITEHSLTLAETSFRSVFNDNYQLITEMAESGIEVPDAWRNIAGYILNLDLKRFFENGNLRDIRQLEQVLQDLSRWNLTISDKEALNLTISERVYREISDIQDDVASLSRIQWLTQVLLLVQTMGIEPDIWRSQNVFYLITKGYRKKQWEFLNEEWKEVFEELASLLKVRLEA